MEESKESIAAAAASEFKIDDKLRDGFRIPFDSLIDLNMTFGPLQATIQWLADRQQTIEQNIMVIDNKFAARQAAPEV